MEDKERSVVERLEDIENKISTLKPNGPIAISDVIGMPFSSYMEQSTVYGIEKDERKFKSSIKKQTVMPIVCLSIFFVCVVIHLIAFFTIKGNEWILLIGDLLAILFPTMILLVLSKQKCKQPMKSFWNIKNTEFYFVPDGEHKKISHETKNGFWYFILLITKILSLLTCLALTFIYFFFNLEINQPMFWISSVFGYLALITCVLTLKFNNPYNFFYYIFEVGDSYVTYPYLDYVKKDK